MPTDGRMKDGQTRDGKVKSVYPLTYSNTGGINMIDSSLK